MREGREKGRRGEGGEGEGGGGEQAIETFKNMHYIYSKCSGQGQLRERERKEVKGMN